MNRKLRVGLIFSLLAVNSSPSLLAAEKKSVTILTLNVALLTVLFGKFSIGLKHNKNRAALIGQAIKKMSPQPDIILLQEAFDKTAVQKHLYPFIKSIYPHAFFDARSGAYLAGVNSGLVILSKYPITQKMQKDFTCWAGVEAFARKGIMGAKIMVDGCPLGVFTAHFQAGIDRSWYVKLAGGVRSRSCEGKDPSSLNSSEIVVMELRQAKKEIDSFVGGTTTMPIIFAGDFNISRERDEKDYYEFKKIFPQAVDSYYHGSQIIKSSSWEKGEVAETETDRVDYVWLLNPTPHSSVKSDIIKNFTSAMTDHLGILATIELSCQ